MKACQSTPVALSLGLSSRARADAFTPRFVPPRPDLEVAKACAADAPVVVASYKVVWSYDCDVAAAAASSAAAPAGDIGVAVA